MNVLLVEDEIGIREGLAALLRLKGHVVETADTCARGHEILDREDFDLVVTDWRLGDGTAEAVARRCPGRVIVMTGYPQEVGLERSAETIVLRKPVAPRDLLAEVERPTPLRQAATPAALPAELPRDLHDRIELLRALTGVRAENSVLRAEGDCVVLEATLPDRSNLDDALPVLERLGGDLRLLDDGATTILELRLYRDGRPESTATVVRPHEAWPDGVDDLAIDFHDEPCTPAKFQELAERCAKARQNGRTVHFLNTPGHLRLHLEILEADHLLPKRPVSGPRLPEVLTELWRHG